MMEDEVMTDNIEKDIKVNEEAEVKKTESEIEFEKKVEELAKEIRLKSKKEELYTEIMTFKKPLSLTKVELKEIFGGLNTEKYKDICYVVGAKCTYYYSEQHMTKNFAITLSLVTDRDLYKLFAEVIRKDSKVYKRTTNPKFFSEEPYKLTKLQIKDIENNIHSKDEYNDIKTVKASNSVINFYSEKYLSQQYAKSLCEWQEVEIFECP